MKTEILLIGTLFLFGCSPICDNSKALIINKQQMPNDICEYAINDSLYMFDDNKIAPIRYFKTECSKFEVGNRVVLTISLDTMETK